MAYRPRPNPGNYNTYNDGTYVAGDIVVASVLNPIENPLSRGKCRPFVLVCRVDGHWSGMGLTTNPRYTSGEQRASVPDYRAVGLDRPGFLWGDRLTNVSVLDIRSVIGRVDASLAEAVIALADLTGRDAVVLRAAGLLDDSRIAG